MVATRTRLQRKQKHQREEIPAEPKEREYVQDGFTHHSIDTFLCSWRSHGDATLQDLTQYREHTQEKSKKRKSSSSLPSVAASQSSEANTIIKLHLLCGSWMENTDYGDNGPSIKRRLSGILLRLHREFSALHKGLKIKYETGIICVDAGDNDYILQALLEDGDCANPNETTEINDCYTLSNLPMDALPSLVLTIQQPRQKVDENTYTHKSTIRFMESWMDQDLMEFITIEATDIDDRTDKDGRKNKGADNDDLFAKDYPVPYEFIAEVMSSIVQSNLGANSRKGKAENSNSTTVSNINDQNQSRPNTETEGSSEPSQTPMSGVTVKKEVDTDTAMEVDEQPPVAKKRPLESSKEEDTPAKATADKEEEPSTSGSNPSSSSAMSAIRIFVAGDRMSVGKSSICLGIIGTLLNKMGYTADSLAYIKPATQSESLQPVQVFCEARGIACVPIGPVVFYRGFTRAFLAGTTESTDSLLAQVQNAVDKLAEGKRVIVIDGVGFPAVGSICGTDNASVALASGYPTADGSRMPPAVVVVGGSGVGSAVDAFNLNSTFFEMQKIPVIGAIFNKLNADETSFYSLQNCKEQVSLYFSQNDHQRAMGRTAFGFVPLGPKLSVPESVKAKDVKIEDGEGVMEQIESFVESFAKHVDVPNLMKAAKDVQGQTHLSCTRTSDTVYSQTNGHTPPAKKAKVQLQEQLIRTREEIEKAAIEAGAAPSA